MRFMVLVKATRTRGGVLPDESPHCDGEVQ